MIRRIKKGDMVQPQNLEKSNYSIDEDGIFIPDSQRQRYRKIEEAKKYNEGVRQFTRDHGGFTLLRISDAYAKIDPATIGRLAFLSTYLSFGNRLLITEENVPMRKGDLSGILCLSRPTTNNFYDECIESNLMFDRGTDGLYLNELFYRGKVNKTDKSKQARLYCDTVRSLYHMMEPKKHSRFGYVVQLIPFLNWEWNVVCKNPEERDSDAVVPMSLTDICNELEIDVKHIARFHQSLTEPIFEYQGEMQQLCASMQTKTSQGMQKTLYVNPNLIYAGSDFTKVEGISIAFKPRSKSKSKKAAV